MLSLAEYQTRVRGAIVGGQSTSLASILAGGRDPDKRLAIHRRHYETSLARALMGRFPALNWLVGSPDLIKAARDFIRCHPPRTPCIAEYGEKFPAFLVVHPNTARFPWIRWIGELEWHVGAVVLEIEQSPLTAAALSGLGPEQLPDLTLGLQPGLRYLAAPWPIDDLLELFLAEQAPARYALDARDVYLEIRGARGAFTVARLDQGTFVFRNAIACGCPVGAAAEQAMEIAAALDPGLALADLLAGGLVTSIRQSGQGGA